MLLVDWLRRGPPPIRMACIVAVSVVGVGSPSCCAPVVTYFVEMVTCCVETAHKQEAPSNTDDSPSCTNVFAGDKMTWN